jgi:hypothetical protein
MMIHYTGPLQVSSFVVAWLGHPPYAPLSPRSSRLRFPSSNAGSGHRILITWGSNKFTLYNFNNHVLQDCRNLNTNTVWSGCRCVLCSLRRFLLLSPSLQSKGR